MARPTLSAAEVEASQTAILDAAEALFEADGVAGTSLRRIAARMGCSAMALYRYFPSKAHVVRGLRIRGYHAMATALGRAAEAEPGAGDRVRRIAEAYVEFARTRTRAYDLLFQVSDAEEEDVQLAHAKSQALDVCRMALVEADRAGHIVLGTDALTAAHLFWAAAHGAVSLHLSGQLVMGRSLEDVAPLLIETLLGGLSLTEDAA